MKAYLWSYIVKADKIDEFRAAYSPSGDWAKLFEKSPDYRGTKLLQSADDRRRFMTIDCFQSPDGRAKFLQSNADAYAALDRRWQGATLEETFVGEFDMVE